MRSDRRQIPCASQERKVGQRRAASPAPRIPAGTLPRRDQGSIG